MWKANGQTDGRRTLTHDKSSHGLWSGELINRGDEITKKSSPRKLLSQSQPNFAERMLGNCVRQCRPVSKMAAVTKNRNFFKWPKLPKFELYKHNDELFNIYYGTFYELWTFAEFDRLCKLEKRGMKFKKNLLLWNYWANLHQTLLKWSLGGSLSKLCPSAPSCIQDGRHY